MPTDTLEAAGRSRCADPIGRARHPPNAGKRRANPSRNRPGKGRFRPFRQDMQTRKATPAERGISKATTKPISRRSVTPTLHGTPAESPRQSPAPGRQFRNAYRRHAGRKRLRRRGPAKSQAALRPPKTYARQAGCRPGFSCGPLTRIRETISRPVPCLLPVLSLSLIRLGKPGRTKATASQGGENPHAQSGRSDARARETDPNKGNDTARRTAATKPVRRPDPHGNGGSRKQRQPAAGTIRNRSETP